MKLPMAHEIVVRVSSGQWEKITRTSHPDDWWYKDPAENRDLFRYRKGRQWVEITSD